MKHFQTLREQYIELLRLRILLATLTLTKLGNHDESPS